MARITSQITLPIEIEKGKFASNLEMVKKILEAHNGHTLEVTFKRRRNKRSNAQNNYYWKVIVGYFMDAIYDSWGEIMGKEEVHNFLKSHCNVEEMVNEDTGEIVRRPRGVSENDTAQEVEYHQKCRQLGRDYFNIDIPLPKPKDDEIDLDFNR